jgi:iron complex transport system substrate-binding protein
MHLVTRTVAALAAVLTALALVACGSDDGASGGSASTPSTAAETAFPVTVGHKFGSTTIPSAPKRVVAVGYTDQDPVLALGVVPVGVGDLLGGYSGVIARWHSGRSAARSRRSSRGRRSTSRRSPPSARTSSSRSTRA